MTTRTKAYKHLGKTTYRVHVYRDDGDDPYAGYLAETECPNFGLAKGWTNRKLPSLAANETGPDETAWARVERGAYEDESFDDPRVGHVLNATWEPDSTEWFAHLEPNGIEVRWDEG